ncbi:flavin-containing monooxygenase [Aspergillus stella-maris]|uniref:flavin-containing monooxygenase n=1 Tax=Aspergillus stella-maris TaxID=1810926 RepID=UPI003CCDC2E1
MKTNIRDFTQTNGSTALTLELDALVVGVGFSGMYLLHELRKLGLKSVIFEAWSDVGGTWKTWNWSSNYFDHITQVLDIRKDCAFNTVVVGAEFDQKSGRWHVTTQDSRRATANHLGKIDHSSFWPETGVDMRGKRVAVVGTGASGVQLTQALGPVAGSLTVFQRSPNYALPTHRRALTVEEQERLKPLYPQLCRLRETGFAGFLYTFSEKVLPQNSPEEQERVFQALYKGGGFRYTLATYKDGKREIFLRQKNSPYVFGGKRLSLEIDYFEQFNRRNVQLVDFSEKAISTSGGLMDMGLRSVHGTSLRDDWNDSVLSYLGLTISGYLNLFFLYSPHGPTAICNGPSAIEVQGRWIVDAIKLMERSGIRSIDPTPEAVRGWKDKINALSNMTLFPTVKTSTLMGGNVPGKPVE